MLNVFVAFGFLFGAIIGSFANCLAWRLYHNENLWGRSKCPKCQQQISWYDNVPILSFLLLGAKCRHCKVAIAWQYPLAELIIGALFAWVAYFHLAGLDLMTMLQTVSTVNAVSMLILRDWLVLFFLSVIFIMDFKWYVVADEISITAVVVIFLVNVMLGLIYPELAGDLIWHKLLLAIGVGAGVFAAQYYLSGGTWVGAGDMRIGALMGAVLGWTGVLTGLFLAYFVGAVFAVGLVLAGKKKMNFKNLIKAPAEPEEAMILPFGPFLAVGTLIAMFYGEALMTWYTNLYLFF